MKKWFVGLSLVLSGFLIKEAMFPRVYVDTSALSYEPVYEPVEEEPIKAEAPVQPQKMQAPQAQEIQPQVPQQVPAVQEVAQPAPPPQPNPAPQEMKEENNSKEELLRQVNSSSLVSCQTQIRHCEPKNESAEMSNPDQDTFCVTYAYNCSSRDSIQRIFSEEEVFPPRENSGFAIDQDPAPVDQEIDYQESQNNNQDLNPYPENPYNDPSLPGYQQPVENPYGNQHQDSGYEY